MISQLVSWDHDLFFFINSDLANPVFDFLMPWFREAKIWIPLYVLFVYLLIRLKKRQSWLWIIGLILSVGASDYIASGLFKPYFERPRPCHHTQLNQEVILRKPDGNCGGSYGFASSHASNHFAIALFLSLTFAGWYKKWVTYALFLWAFSIGFAQIYVGVHFPGDVVMGAIIGLFTSFLLYRLTLFASKRLFS